VESRDRNVSGQERIHESHCAAPQPAGAYASGRAYSRRRRPGQNIEEEAETLAINAHGALVLMKARLTSGCKVLLQHKRTQEEQECHVAFLGPVRAGKAEIGLEFSSPRPAFWRVAFPPEDWTPRSRKRGPSPASAAIIRGSFGCIQALLPALSNPTTSSNYDIE